MREICPSHLIYLFNQPFIVVWKLEFLKNSLRYNSVLSLFAEICSTFADLKLFQVGSCVLLKCSIFFFFFFNAVPLFLALWLLQAHH